ncbi:MAG: hypothetical protein KKG76_11345 [Euryarchaeota archaeon]|nr:hypothetical protein [Euryarchaeota archaeon]
MVEEQAYASASASIYLESSAENITIYVPVFLDEKKSALKLYENPTITGSVKTSLIDTEHGKALKIVRSGFGNYVFNWNEVPGKDTGRFVRWIENIGYTQPGEKLDITKTDDGTTIKVSGRMTFSGTNTLIVRLNEENILDFYNMEDNRINQKWVGTDLFFAKEENGGLNIYTGNNEINIKESHGKLKEDKQISDEFFSRFTISMSNYTSPEHFIDMPYYEYDSDIDAWVYSDSEVEKFSIDFSLDPKNSIDRIVLSVMTKDGRVHLRKGWQVVKLSIGKIAWD